jgi:type I restriction enzyme, R subunit
MQQLLTGKIRVMSTERRMTMNQNYNEMDLSQKPALEVLEKMGYIILKPEEAEVMRGSKYAVILQDVLRKQIQKINAFEYRGRKTTFLKKISNRHY